MKYIVKNCPSYDYDEEFNYHICKRNLAIFETTCDECQECTDCLIKQMIDKDTNIINTTFNKECFELAKNIINMFDIEEIKE